MSVYSLIQRTPAYKIFSSDVKSGRYSHAYLLVCRDKKYLRGYLKYFAKAVLCERGSNCGECRRCRLIEAENFADLKIYPATAGDKIKVEDVENLIEESYVKPVENDKKVFIIDCTDDLSAVCQNKLLKTLEEPPENVILLLGAVSEFTLLSTVLSRVKTLKTGEFTKEELVFALKEDCPDEKRLNLAIENSDGTAGKTEMLYGDERLNELTAFAGELVSGMVKSTDVMRFSDRAVAFKNDFKEFLSVLKQEYYYLLKDGERRTELGYTEGAVISAIDEITKAEKKTYYNANVQMVADALFLKILENKFKWKQATGLNG